MKTTNLRVPDDLHKALKKSADKNYRSVNGEILAAIGFYLRLGSKLTPDEVEKLFYSKTDGKKQVKE